MAPGQVRGGSGQTVTHGLARRTGSLDARFRTTKSRARRRVAHEAQSHPRHGISAGAQCRHVQNTARHRTGHELPVGAMPRGAQRDSHGTHRTHGERIAAHGTRRSGGNSGDSALTLQAGYKQGWRTGDTPGTEGTAMAEKEEGENSKLPTPARPTAATSTTDERLGSLQSLTVHGRGQRAHLAKRADISMHALHTVCETAHECTHALFCGETDTYI